MTVKEHIAQLMQFDQDLPIRIKDAEGNLYEPTPELSENEDSYCIDGTLIEVLPKVVLLL